ncbi:CubicO group peptidase (beta-lactamase class C family) [Massilia sp. MP_M2]
MVKSEFDIISTNRYSVFTPSHGLLTYCLTLQNWMIVKKKNVLELLLSITLCSCAGVVSAAAAGAPSTHLQLMERTATTLRNTTGASAVSVGVVFNGKTYSHHDAKHNAHSGVQASDATLFEIGSVSKVFAGTLVAQAVVDGKLTLDDDVRMHLSGAYSNLQFDGQPIRIRHLLTHKTGIDVPFPDTREIRLKFPAHDFIAQKNVLDARYTKDDFFKELAAANPTALPGTRFKYGALGPELCAVILEKVYGKGYDTLLREFVLGPAGMAATRLRLGPTQRLATGFNAKGREMDPLSSNLWGASKFLKSTMGDMLSFATYELASRNPAVLESRRLIDPDGKMAYFWEVEKDRAGGWNYVKDGGSNGTSSIIKILPARGLGIVIVVNQSDVSTGTEIGAALDALENELLAVPTSDNGAKIISTIP